MNLTSITLTNLCGLSVLIKLYLYISTPQVLRGLGTPKTTSSPQSAALNGTFAFQQAEDTLRTASLAAFKVLFAMKLEMNRRPKENIRNA